MKIKVILVIGFFLVSSVAVWAAKAPARGTLVGTVVNEAIKAPINDSVIRILNVVTGKEYRSEPSEPNGSFTVNGIEEGRYALSMITAAGEFSFGQKIMIKGSEIGRLDLWLRGGSEDRPDSLEPVLSPGAGTVTATCWDWWEWLRRWFHRSGHGCWFSDDD